MMLKINDIRENYATYKYLTMCLLSIVILLITVSFIVWPLYEEHLSFEQESKAMQQKLQIFEQFATSYPHFEEERNKRAETIAELEQQLPSSLDGIDVVTKVQSLAKSSGVILNASRITNSKIKEGRLISTGVDVKAKGSYAAMLSFLEKLEQSSLTGLEKLQLEAGSDGMLMLKGKYYVYGLKER